MGFLLGALGKQMAGKRLRQLQARMMSVQSQLRRATRDLETQEKQLNQEMKYAKIQQQSSVFSYMQGMSGRLPGAIWEGLESTFGTERIAELKAAGGNMFDLMTTTEANAYNQMQQQISMQFQYQQQAMQANMQQQMAMYENNMEAYKEMMLQPYKDREEELQTEKDSLETQIQLANQDYEACKEMEKAGAKQMAPQYTGQ